MVRLSSYAGFAVLGGDGWNVCDAANGGGLDDMTPRVGNDDGGNSDRGISVVAGQPFEDFLAVPKRRRRQTANDQTSDGGGKRCPVRRVARRASVR